MLKMIYLDLADGKYHIMTLPDGTSEPLTREGDEKTSFLGLGEQCAYYSKVKYTLREDMARKLQYRFFRYDMKSGASHELFTKWDRSSFQLMTFIPLKDGRFFLLAARDYTVNQGYFADAEGEHPQLLWETSGYPYSFSPSPDGNSFAYHMALEDGEFNPHGGHTYSVNLMLPDGSRRYVYGEDGKVCFGPVFSPDGQYLAFVLTIPVQTEGDRTFAEICICRPDGTDFRRLTTGNAHYYRTNAGLEKHRTSGSNRVIWTPEGQLIYSRRLPGSQTDVYFDATQANHEEWIYDPTRGKGGCGLTLLDPATGAEVEITPALEGQWDFRPTLSADGKRLLFTRSRFGEATEICLMNRETGETRVITRGTDGVGADHSSFLELPD